MWATLHQWKLIAIGRSEVETAAGLSNGSKQRPLAGAGGTTPWFRPSNHQLLLVLKHHLQQQQQEQRPFAMIFGRPVPGNAYTL